MAESTPEVYFKCKTEDLNENAIETKIKEINKDKYKVSDIVKIIIGKNPVTIHCRIDTISETSIEVTDLIEEIDNDITTFFINPEQYVKPKRKTYKENRKLTVFNINEIEAYEEEPIDSDIEEEDILNNNQNRCKEDAIIGVEKSYNETKSSVTTVCTKDELKKKSIKHLKELCKDLDISGYSKLKKENTNEFIEKILNKYKVNVDTEELVDNVSETKIDKEELSTLYDLINLIKTKSIKDLFTYCENDNEKGYLYEKIWDIIIKCGFHFQNPTYKHMNGNDLETMSEINDLETYFKNTKTFRKKTGNSDNTIFLNNIKTWIFVSSKFYKDDCNKTIGDYDIERIITNINKHKEIYKKYEIWLFVKDKKKVNTIIEHTKDTDESIVECIKCVMDYNDLEKYYSQLQIKLQDIDLTITGEINKEFYTKFIEPESREEELSMEITKLKEENVKLQTLHDNIKKEFNSFKRKFEQLTL
jgi:hypothetical protein